MSGQERRTNVRKTRARSIENDREEARREDEGEMGGSHAVDIGVCGDLVQMDHDSIPHRALKRV